MFSGAGAGSRKKFHGAGAASRQDGSETLLLERLWIIWIDLYTI